MDRDGSFHDKTTAVQITVKQKSETDDGNGCHSVFFQTPVYTLGKPWGICMWAHQLGPHWRECQQRPHQDTGGREEKKLQTGGAQLKPRRSGYTLNIGITRPSLPVLDC